MPDFAYTYLAPCNQTLGLRREGETLVLAAPCEKCGATDGMEVVDLRECCLRHQQQAKTGSVPATVEPAAPCLPAVEEISPPPIAPGQEELVAKLEAERPPVETTTPEEYVSEVPAAPKAETPTEFFTELTAEKVDAAPVLNEAFLPQAADSNLTALLSGFGSKEEADIDIDSALASIGLEGGPSTGGFSWHTLEPCMQCWRKAYYRHILALTPKKSRRALQFGTLFHACWELHYSTGGQRKWSEPCDAVRTAGGAELAAEVQRLVYTAIKKYGKEESETWDIRAVEQNAVFWLPPMKVGTKTVQIPICCRHDLIVAKKEPQDPYQPYGPVPQGVYICDHKSASALTYDQTMAYSVDPQFLTNALVYIKSDEPEKFGPLNGVIISIAAKHKQPSPEKSLFRVETGYNLEQIEEFCQYEIAPTAAELYLRISQDAYRSDATRWPKNHSQCVGKYGLCEYYPICDIGDTMIESMFNQDDKRILTVDKLAPPPVEVKRKAREEQEQADPVKQEAAKKRRGKSEKRVELVGKLLQDYSTSISYAAEQGNEGYARFASKNYLVPNHTVKDVKASLTSNLQLSWDVGTKFEFQANGTSYLLEIKDKGLSWEAEGLRGQLSWKKVAEAICADWWDLQKFAPLAGDSSSYAD